MLKQHSHIQGITMSTKNIYISTLSIIQPFIVIFLHSKEDDGEKYINKILKARAH